MNARKSPRSQRNSVSVSLGYLHHSGVRPNWTLNCTAAAGAAVMGQLQRQQPLTPRLAGPTAAVLHLIGRRRAAAGPTA